MPVFDNNHQLRCSPHCAITDIFHEFPDLAFGVEGVARAGYHRDREGDISGGNLIPDVIFHDIRHGNVPSVPNIASRCHNFRAVPWYFERDVDCRIAGGCRFRATYYVSRFVSRQFECDRQD